METFYGRYRKKKPSSNPLTMEQQKTISNFVLQKMKQKLKPFYMSKKRIRLPICVSNAVEEKKKKDGRSSDDYNLKSAQSYGLIQMMKTTHRRAKSHLQKECKNFQQNVNKKKTKDGMMFDKKIKIWKPSYFDFGKIKKRQKEYFYPTIDESISEKNKKNESESRYEKEQGNRREWGDLIDEIDLQFKEGLIQNLYSTERLKRRKKINQEKWRQQIRGGRRSVIDITDQNGKVL